MAYPSFRESRTALLAQETSCTTLVSSFLDRIEADNERLNAFISIQKEQALQQAKALDEALAQGDSKPLAGLVMGIKDLICIRDVPVTCGSRILAEFTSLYDATAIARLKEQGAIFIGKTNCDEFAMGSSNESSHFGPVRNPAAEERVPGGSSGGSAAAVAAGFCHASLGSDTGGSIRQPASFCGVVGLKPTYGRVSRFGLVAYASSFDCIGPFAHSVEDVALILEAMAGVDPHDSTSAPIPVDAYSQDLDAGVEGLRVGMPEEYFAEGLDPHVQMIVEKGAAKLEAAGAVITPVSLPHTEYGISTYYILATAEASSNLARYDGVRYGYRADMKQIRQDLTASRQALKSALTAAQAAGRDDEASELQEQIERQSSLLHEMYVQSRSEGFGDEVKRRIMLGTYVLSSGYYDAYYGKAQRARTLIRQDFDRVFEEVDVLLTPAAPTPAFKLGSKLDDPLAMYLGDVYTVTANLAGIPGLVVPGGLHPDEQLPVGLQLLGPHFSERSLLQVGHSLMGNQ